MHYSSWNKKHTISTYSIYILNKLLTELKPFDLIWCQQTNTASETKYSRLSVSDSEHTVTQDISQTLEDDCMLESTVAYSKQVHLFLT